MVPKSSNKKGFTYVVAIGILGLLAFMGLFLMQSSSAEYSQTSISVYRTMGRQLAEAAAEEACVILEERFKDKSSTGFFQQLMLQASTSGSLKSGGSTGKNPLKLDDFTDLKKKVTQTLALRDYHVSRAGFAIDKILPTIKDLRPIPNGVADSDDSYYRPTDRDKAFDNEFSKSWYCTLQIDVTLSLEKAQKISINYQISKDIKLLNLAPIARNYSFFSILGIPIADSDQATTQSNIRNAMNPQNQDAGRLILWNVPFQSRVYLHGPAIINLENPALATDRESYGAYNMLGEGNSGPGINQAYQYSQTFYGFSYFPTISRCLFPSKNFSGLFSAWLHKTETMGDSLHLAGNFNGIVKHETVQGGLLPEKDPGFWKRIGESVTEGLTNNYFTGTNVKQLFLPAGLYCCTPWRYVAPTPEKGQPKWNNIRELPPMNFPDPDSLIRLEHAWRPDDEECAENSKIYSKVNGIKYNHVTGGITRSEETTEFGLSYYNNPDPEGFLAKLGSSLGSALGGIWNVVTFPAQTVGHIVSLGWNKLFPPSDTTIDSEEVKTFPNLLPTNFMFNYQGVVTRRLANEHEIPKDSAGRWILNGVYMLDSLTIDAPVVYVGTGTLLVSNYVEDKPLTIKGDIFAKQDSNGKPEGHLNIFYHPYSGSNRDASKRMLVIDGSNGKGITVEASVYSCYGIKSISPDGSSISDFTELGADPSKPFDQWGTVLDNAKHVSNIIVGNYINYYINLAHQKNDLWIFHNKYNACYFQNYKGVLTAVQDIIDQDKNAKKDFEYSTHEFFMSPKIQHIGIRGAL